MFDPNTQLGVFNPLFIISLQLDPQQVNPAHSWEPNANPGPQAWHEACMGCVVPHNKELIPCPTARHCPGARKRDPCTIWSLLETDAVCSSQGWLFLKPSLNTWQKWSFFFFPPSDLHLTFTVNVESKPLFWSEPGVKQLPALIPAHRLVVKHYDKVDFISWNLK